MSQPNAYVQHFKTALIADGKLPKTVKSYVLDVSMFLQWLEEKTGHDFDGTLTRFYITTTTQYGVVNSKNANAKTITLEAALSSDAGKVTISKAIAKETTTISANATTITVGDETKYNIGELIRIEGATTQYAVVTDNTQNQQISVCGTNDGKLVADAGIDGTTLYIFKAQGVVYSLNTDAKLAANTQYQFVLSGVKDAAGNEMKKLTDEYGDGSQGGDENSYCWYMDEKQVSLSYTDTNGTHKVSVVEYDCSGSTDEKSE